MNKDDIKKALEFCANDFPCEGCAYHDDLTCTDKLKTDALNVIIEQEQEIEKWKNDYAKLQEQFAQYQMASDKEIIAQRKQAKIEVLNKLKERVETAIDAYFNLDSGGYYLAEGALDDIDELIETEDITLFIEANC